MGDRVPKPGPLGGLKRDLKTLRKGVRMSQSFTGTQYASTADTVDGLDQDLSGVVQQVVSDYSYSRDAVDGFFGAINDQITKLDDRITELEKGRVIRTAPNGTRYELGVSNSGASTWTAV